MHTIHVKALAMLAGAAVAAGCAGVATDSSRDDAEGSLVPAAELEASQRRINELESALAAKERDLASAEANMSNMSEKGAGDIAATGSTKSSNVSLYPPNPKAGECYARVMIPATYETVSERVMASDASERIEVIPARYETVQERVLVKEASTRLEVVPAVYGEVQERVLVKPASKKIVEIPAVYRTVTERVLDKPAHTAWKKGPASIQSANVLSESVTEAGEIMCLVEVPATYKTIEKRVLVTPARTSEVEVPAEYKTVTRTVVRQPATTREVTVPAQYETVEVTKLLAPAKQNRIAIPARYQTVTRNNKISDDRMEWRQVVCEVNMTPDNVRVLQKALADKGYYKIAVDGIIGRQTLSAASRYAADNNLPAGSNYIPVEVVKSLNLDL